jgi:hypothetical protein
VQRARGAWERIVDPDLVLDAGAPLSHNLDMLGSLLDHARSN